MELDLVVEVVFKYIFESLKGFLLPVNIPLLLELTVQVHLFFFAL